MKINAQVVGKILCYSPEKTRELMNSIKKEIAQKSTADKGYDLILAQRGGKNTNSRESTCEEEKSKI
jgi:hypothetical protein